MSDRATTQMMRKTTLAKRMLTDKSVASSKMAVAEIV
jgi:hypothetical protein